MRDTITAAAVRQLAEVRDRFCVSCYLRTHTAGRDVEQDPIRFKNLIGQARDEMSAMGASVREIDDLHATAQQLLDDRDFWNHQADALAVLASGSDLQRYRIGAPIEDLVVVARGFHLTPLIGASDSEDVFFVLALSRHQVRLARSTQFGAIDVTDDRIVPSLEAALRHDDREPQLQSHASSRAGTGSVVARFHGQGAGKDTSGADLRRFLTMVDHGVRAIVGARNTPLVLAGVQDITAEFAKLSKHGALVDTAVVGNPERLSVTELGERARPLIEPWLNPARRHAYDRISERSVPTMTAVPDVVLAAHDGRVATLFVAQGAHRWGSCEAERRSVVQHDERRTGDRDLLDVAAVESIRHGGQVYVVPREDVPNGSEVVAELRG